MKSIIEKTLKCGISFFLIVQSILFLYGKRQPKIESVDALIVLGCRAFGRLPSRSLLERLKVAKSFVYRHPNTPIIVSGAQGSDEVMAEAQVMYRWLRSNGVDSIIIKEDESISTMTNLEYSKRIMKERGMGNKVGIVTNDFHSFRAVLIAKQKGFDAISFPAKTPLSMIFKGYIREFFAIIYTVVPLFPKRRKK